MRRTRYVIYNFLLILITFGFGTVFVVERERGSLAVIEKHRLIKEIKDLGNLNHATLKFFKGYGYLISRDGYLSKIDPENYKLIKRIKAGESAIGLNFCPDKVLVANYAPKSVAVFSENLKLLKEIKTNSRNVGIKSDGKLFVYALMDKDSLQVRDCKTLKLVKEIKAGDMPFDALLYGGTYIVGFFKENTVGVLNLKTLKYKKVRFKKEKKEVVFKIPHFGLWGVKRELAFIPVVGERKVRVVNLKTFEYVGDIPVKGLPVFVQVSPDGNYLAVNYSGDSEDYLTLIELKTLKPVKTKKNSEREFSTLDLPRTGGLYTSPLTLRGR